MRILFLFGNGFDIHVGLHTAYSDFLAYYLRQPESAYLDDVSKRYIKRLKQDIENNIELWSDLELQLGRHTSKFGTMGSDVHTLEEEFDIVNDDIREKLAVYISNEDKRIFFNEATRSLFIKDLINPIINLRDYERNQINQYKINKWRGSERIVDIITFNYTYTFEKLLGDVLIQFDGFQVNEPIHIHGYYNNRMILGVNDRSQIKNKELSKAAFATDALIKSECNHTYGTGHTDKCLALISTTQLICCYGLSFGDTDKIWWKAICDVLRNRNDIIVVLFTYISNFTASANEGHKKQRIIRSVAEKLSYSRWCPRTRKKCFERSDSRFDK